MGHSRSRNEGSGPYTCPREEQRESMEAVGLGKAKSSGREDVGNRGVWKEEVGLGNGGVWIEEVGLGNGGVWIEEVGLGNGGVWIEEVRL